MLNPIQESIIVLSVMKNIMEPALKVFKRYHDDEDVKFILHSKMLIDLSSFLEEWARLGPICKNNPDLIFTLKICEPALSRLKRWDGIRQFRNKALAHGFREELKGTNGKVVYSPTNLSRWYFDANVPNNYAEVLLLSEMAYFCMAIFISRHGNENQGLDFTHKEEVESKGIQSTSEFDEVMIDFMNHIKSMDATIERTWNGYRYLSDVIANK